MCKIFFSSCIKKYYRFIQVAFLGANFLTNLLVITLIPHEMKTIALITFISSLLGAIDLGGSIVTLRDQDQYVVKDTALRSAFELVWIPCTVAAISILIILVQRYDSIILMCLASCPVFAVMSRITLASELSGNQELNIKMYGVAFVVNGLSLAYFVSMSQHSILDRIALGGFILIRLLCFLCIFYICRQELISVVRAQVYKINLSDITRQWMSAIYGISEGFPRIILSGSETVTGVSALYVYELAARSVAGFTFFYNIFLARMKKTRNYFKSHVIILYALIVSSIIFLFSIYLGYLNNTINSDTVLILPVALGVAISILFTVTRYLFLINMLALGVKPLMVVLGSGVLLCFLSKFIHGMNPIIMSLLPIGVVSILFILLYRGVYPKYDRLFLEKKIS